MRIVCRVICLSFKLTCAGLVVVVVTTEVKGLVPELPQHASDLTHSLSYCVDNESFNVRSPSSSTVVAHGLLNPNIKPAQVGNSPRLVEINNFPLH